MTLGKSLKLAMIQILHLKWEMMIYLPQNTVDIYHIMQIGDYVNAWYLVTVQ